MFDGLLKSKFYSKCESAVKMTKTQSEYIKTKRSVMQMNLKKDVVYLLKNGWDAEAYDRVEGLWKDLNLSSCYDLVEQYCMNILSHLATMDKQRECPEECREAASSLMFAAARFSDLPGLRKLRTVFTERLGNFTEYYVNKEFEHKLKSTPPTKDMKLQLIQEIALESGIEWNSKTFEHKLYKNSRKKLPHDTGESEANLKASHPAAISRGRGTKDRGKDGPPTRAASLRSVSSPAEAPKLHARASSFQPEVLNSNRHIHPKLPDYDDFVAKLAALQATLR